MSFRNLILNNVWWKLLSLFLAMLIWFNVRSSLREEIQINQGGVPLLQNPTRSVSGELPAIPVKVLTPPGTTNVYKVEPAEVQVTVQGERVLLAQLHSRDVQVFVDLTDVKEGQSGARPRNFARTVQVYTPPGVVFVKVEPSAVSVERVVAPPRPVQPPANTKPNEQIP